FRVEVNKEASRDFEMIRRSGDKAMITKLEQIIYELSEHPDFGTGRPERLKHHLSGYWSRRLNKKDRLIYQILGDEVVVIVVSALGHY
ncbi:MAG: Txe/YoeB family addiction module toxin, partial [Saprospiraceae bacterium]